MKKDISIAWRCGPFNDHWGAAASLWGGSFAAAPRASRAAWGQTKSGNISMQLFEMSTDF